MKSKKQMRNIFIKRIDDILIRYYKEMDFNLLATSDCQVGELCCEGLQKEENRMESFRRGFLREEGEEHCQKAMELIDLMRELELVNAAEYDLLKEVSREYFSLHKC